MLLLFRSGQSIIKADCYCYSIIIIIIIMTLLNSAICSMLLTIANCQLFKLPRLR